MLLILLFIAIVHANDRLFPALPVALLEPSPNSTCAQQSAIYAHNLNNFTLWAQEMWDATAKSASGILRGNKFQMGHFEECLTAPAPFATKYCMATVRANIPKVPHRDPKSLDHDPNESVLDRLYPYEDVSQQERNVVQIGWCIPASCSNIQLEEYLNHYLQETNFSLKTQNVNYSAVIPEIFCHVNNQLQLSAADVTFCVLTVTFVLIVIVATIVDYQTNDKQPKNIVLKLLDTFSTRQNFNDLTRKDETDSALSVLYGMRTICMLFIILDHRFGTFTSSALLNFDYVERQYRAQLAPVIFHGDVFVDSFFLISGLLATYGLLGVFGKKKFNPGFVVLMRYVRLTPVYAFVIFYYATLFNYTGSGPLWKVIAGQDSQDCKNNWWANLLYINNYVHADHMCMTHAWYLPCDFHYFIIAIGVCFLLNKRKKTGLTLLFALLVLSTIIPFFLTVIYQRPAMLQFYPEFLTGPKQQADFLLTYSKSHARASPYFVGMFGGFLYFQLKGSNKHVCRVKSYTILLISILLIFVSIIGGLVFYDPYHPYNAVESATYAALHRPAFAIGSIGLLYVASYGHATFIYNILSWQPWIPISKLTYGAYLVHMQFQLRSAAKFMSPRQIAYFDVISLAFSDMVMAFLTALALYLTIEAPLRRIFRMVLVPQNKKEGDLTMETANPLHSSKL